MDTERPFAEGWPFHPTIPSYILTRWLFLRLLGLIYLIAFASLLPQIKGLIGANGILPIADFLNAVRANYGADAYRLAPTLSWLNTSDAFLQLLCWGGILASILVIAGLLTAPALAIETRQPILRAVVVEADVAATASDARSR